MDALALITLRILTTIWTLIKKNWIYFVAAAAIGVAVWFYHSSVNWKNEARKQAQNANSAYKEASENAHYATMNLAQAKETEKFRGLLDESKRQNGIKDKRIQWLQSIKAKTEIRDSLIIKTDTLYFADSSNYQLFHSIDIVGKCLTGSANWMQGADKAHIDYTIQHDWLITAYQKRPEKWFWKGDWFPRKWPVEVTAKNRCDTTATFTENIILNITK